MSNKYQLLSEPELLQGADINTYQSIIGTLNYIACTTRYDMSYPVARLAQLAARPTVGSLKAARKALSYLAATNDFKISGIMSPKIDSLEYYSDSDHAGDMPITTCSRTGTVIMLNKVPIHWRSKKQPKTSRSSAEAEIYALSDTLADSRVNNRRLEDIGIKLPDLLSRIQSGLIHIINDFNDDDLRRMLQFRSNLRGMYLSDEVAKFLLTRLSRDSKTLIDALETLDTASLREQRRLTTPFVKSVLKI